MLPFYIGNECRSKRQNIYFKLNRSTVELQQKENSKQVQKCSEEIAHTQKNTVFTNLLIRIRRVVRNKRSRKMFPVCIHQLCTYVTSLLRCICWSEVLSIGIVRYSFTYLLLEFKSCQGCQVPYHSIGRYVAVEPSCYKVDIRFVEKNEINLTYLHKGTNFLARCTSNSVDAFFYVR